MNKFINEKSFSRLVKRMGHWYSNLKKDKEELKDIAIVTASRTRLTNIVNNDKILKDKKYIIGENKWDIDAITQYLKNNGNVLIDKELTVEKVKIKNENGKVIERYVIQSVDEYTYKENEKRNKDLSNVLTVKKYGYVTIKGSFIENGQPEDAETSEKSFFVVNLHNDPDFLTKIAKLSEYYNQDAFIFKAAQDDEAFLIGTNDANPGYHELINIGKLKLNREIQPDDDGKNYSKVGKDKFAFQQGLNKIIQHNVEYVNECNLNEWSYSFNDFKVASYFWENLQVMTKGYLSNLVSPISYAVKQNKNWDWLDEMRNIDVFDDVDFLYERFVYNDYNDFLNRVETHNPGSNGVTKEFLNEFYNGDIKQWVLENKDNTLCFNCKNCVDCKECNECINCVNCRFSEFCGNCNNCKRSKKCVECVKCDRCENCEDIKKRYMFHENVKFIY